MAEITAAMVMKLRDETGLPMMECKKALQDTKRRLRAREAAGPRDRQEDHGACGRIAAPRKAGWPSYAALNPPVGAMIELQVESAPVAKHEDVIALANDLAKQLATGPGAKTPEELWKQPAPSRKGTTLAAMEGRARRQDARGVPARRGFTASTRPSGGYVHHDAKSGVLLEVEGGNDELAKSVAMHVTAMRPKSTTHGRARSGVGRRRNAKSSPSRPARKASRTTSSKR